MIFLLCIFFPNVVYAQNIFDEIQNSIEGEIFILRKKIEEPILQHPIYDLHFRKFDHRINKKELEFSLESETYKKNVVHYNWSLVIPIDEQAYLHFIEANTLWNLGKLQEALFIYKSLTHSKNQEINIKTHKILQKITNSKIKSDYHKLDPYFLYSLENHKTKIVSDYFGFSLSIANYWNIVLTKKNQWFYFIENSEKKRIFLLTNPDYDLYFYITKNNPIRNKIENFIKEIDIEFSWNHNTKTHYSFKREKINSNSYFVNFKHQNQSFYYYEVFFSNISSVLYLRIYHKKSEKENKILQFIDTFAFK